MRLFISRKTGNFLDGSGQEERVYLSQFNDAGFLGGHLQWATRTQMGGWMQIRHVQSEKVLAWNPERGIFLQDDAAAENSDNCLFKTVPVFGTPYFILEHKSTGKNLEISPEGEIRLWDRNHAQSQHWTIMSVYTGNNR